LSEEFGHVLFQRTRGHPLFTIELLRDMQERGALVQDGRGRWLEGPLLDWDELPGRVEGIIEERIGRLEGALRDILSVASVEGQDFTAQVIARVKEIREWELLRVLSQELERRHRLVREREEVKLGRQFLARYQFAHALFQQYLYSQLGAGERRVLRGQIASLLEELYQGHTERIAVQLARHYSEAGEDDRAVDFLVRAGDAAVRLYAHAEARLHYAGALDTLSRMPATVENRRQRVDLLTKRVASSWIADSTEENLGRLAEAERLVRGLAGTDEMSSGDRVRLVNIHYLMGRVHFRGIRMPDVIRHYSQGLTMAQEISDPELLARFSAGIGHALAVQGREAKAESLLRQAMTAQKETGERSEWLQTLAYHGLTTALMGDYALGMAELQRALAGSQELGHITLTCTIQLLLALAHGCGGEPLQAVEDTHKMAEAAVESGDQLLVYVGLGWGAWAKALTGLFEAAEASMDRAQAVAGELGGRLVFADWFLAADAEIALGAGRIQEALDVAGQAVTMAQKVDNPGAEAYARRVWGQALAELEPPRWDEAEAQFAEGLRLYELGQCELWAAQTHTAWGAVCRDRGNLAAAREHWEEAAAQWETSGITWELEKARALIAKLADE
jgi:tetratricopeptide (TPR) repeat protein